MRPGAHQRLLARVARYQQTLSAVAGKQIRGLYTGGTLAAESAGLLAERLGITPDAHHPQGMMLNAQGHQVVDLGDDFYTVGRPHPMIDPSLRNQFDCRTGQGKSGRRVAAGRGDWLRRDRRSCRIAGGSLPAGVGGRDERHPLHIIATVTGTESDPQCRSRQIASLEDAGIVVADSLPEANAARQRAD